MQENFSYTEKETPEFILDLLEGEVVNEFPLIKIDSVDYLREAVFVIYNLPLPTEYLGRVSIDDEYLYSSGKIITSPFYNYWFGGGDLEYSEVGDGLFSKDLVKILEHGDVFCKMYELGNGKGITKSLFVWSEKANKRIKINIHKALVEDIKKKTDKRGYSYGELGDWIYYFFDWFELHNSKGHDGVIRNGESLRGMTRRHVIDGVGKFGYVNIKRD